MKKPQDFGVQEDPSYTSSEEVTDTNKYIRVIIFENLDDLTITKNYYDELGKQSGVLYFHTFFIRVFFIHMNRDLPQETLIYINIVWLNRNSLFTIKKLLILLIS
ncbi:hypothetical protein BCR23_02220 [Enterococcus quebecensis]|uniref:Uncharacterized protein n=1 Tax=Enterococcus quebecensis TaxID=903983 RepID=A0A1E5H3E6_9ENTE|nr:hypothetical protein BCR23_02220 [Enterococcus quebecensis]